MKMEPLFVDRKFFGKFLPCPSPFPCHHLHTCVAFFPVQKHLPLTPPIINQLSCYLTPCRYHNNLSLPLYCARLLYFQIRALMSPEPVANRPPVCDGTGDGATLMTEFLWPWSMSCVEPVLGSQNWTPRSLEPERTHAPSAVRATERTKSC